jgi:lipopolysaccharide export LptBFGC system permease protein LptF
MKNFLLILIAVLFLASCTVEKRLYTGGYHVSFNRSIGQLKAKTSSAEEFKSPIPLISNWEYETKSDTNQVEQVIELVYLSKSLPDPMESGIANMTGDFKASVRSQVFVENVPFLLEENHNCSTVSNRSHFRKTDHTVNKKLVRLRSDFWESFFEVVFWLVLIGLVVLGVMYPLFGTILMIVAVVLLVLLVLVIIAFFAELFDGILELVT